MQTFTLMLLNNAMYTVKLCLYINLGNFCLQIRHHYLEEILLLKVRKGLSYWSEGT
ncbi:hypothetical protein GEOBRER4_n4018 [Citrifermentans bremense]|uniref:Uncharacterized protein n=1 Tax=Citrifermentans bremense TaxID=60035 RepID=A0A7R7FTA0_9BACT|nr:hypothetical protein GEOBRER4_n4018 [Citrifermentans bremense]